MLPMIISAAEHKVLLGPNDLRANLKLRGSEGFRYFSGVHAGMPNIGHIPGEKLVRSAPIGLVVIGYGTNLSLPSQPRSLPPLRVVLYPIRRVRHHQEWLGITQEAITQEAPHVLCRRGVAAEHAMRAADPQIAWKGDRMLG